MATTLTVARSPNDHTVVPQIRPTSVAPGASSVSRGDVVSTENHVDAVAGNDGSS